MALNLDPCIGYIIREPNFPSRKLAILGDTYDASTIEPLLRFPPPSLLVHEATDACIPTSVDPQARRKDDEVRKKVLARGHSTPVMAGEFAKRVGAKRLVLNHIGGRWVVQLCLQRQITGLFTDRFPAPRQLKKGHDVRFAVIDEISRQASEAWGMGYAQVAFDFMRVGIPATSTPAMAVEEVVTIAEGSASVNASLIGDETTESNGGDAQQQRGRRRRRRGWQMRGNYSGKRTKTE